MTDPRVRRARQRAAVVATIEAPRHRPAPRRTPAAHLVGGPTTRREPPTSPMWAPRVSHQRHPGRTAARVALALGVVMVLAAYVVPALLAAGWW